MTTTGLVPSHATWTTERFRCCDTTWRIDVGGSEGPRWAAAAAAVAGRLAHVLNAFDDTSRLRRLETDGFVRDGHVARVVARGLEYLDRTQGAFDIRHGRLQYAIKARIRGCEAPPTPVEAAHVRVQGDDVRADAPIDLNGLAKGYIVDQVHRFLDAARVPNRIDGGGDLSPPDGPVAIEHPTNGSILGVLDTSWSVATSSPWRRRRGPTHHLYDPRAVRSVAFHDQVTVLARRDCMEADALATTLCVLPLEAGMRLVEGWPSAEALWLRQGRLYASGGFDAHVWRP